MIIPGSPYIDYWSIPPGMAFKTWWRRYLLFGSDYLSKMNVDYTSTIFGEAPFRWYGRVNIWNFYARMDRETPKLYMSINIDYEALFVGFTYGMFLTFRYFMDYALGKTPEFRPAEGIVSGRGNHFVLPWRRTHINAKKYFAHDWKTFFWKLVKGAPIAFVYSIYSAIFSWVFTSYWHHHMHRHFPLFWAGLYTTFYHFYYHRDYEEWDIQYITYRQVEETGAAFLLFYSFYRVFRNQVCHVPMRRVLGG